MDIIGSQKVKEFWEIENKFQVFIFQVHMIINEISKKKIHIYHKTNKKTILDYLSEYDIELKNKYIGITLKEIVEDLEYTEIDDQSDLINIQEFISNSKR